MVHCKNVKLGSCDEESQTFSTHKGLAAASLG